MSAPHRAEMANRMVNRLKDTLRRADPPLPSHMRSQLAGLVNHTLQQALRGRAEVHPGMAKMAAWGRCSERQARRNCRSFEMWGVQVVVSHAQGGRKAPRLQVDFAALWRAMVVLDCNPTPAFKSEMDDVLGLIMGRGLASLRADRNPDRNPDTRPDCCPPGLRSSPKGGTRERAGNQTAGGDA